MLTHHSYTIIDEADELISPDWEDEIGKIMSGGGMKARPLLTNVTDSITDTNEDADHHYLLFSATFKPELRKVAKKYLANDHIRIRIGRAGSTHMNVKQIVGLHRGNLAQGLANDGD